MRMDNSGGLSAYDVVNGYDGERLRKIISEYGEERYAARVAGNIVKTRTNKPVETTAELADIVSRAIPRKDWEQHKHPATRTFQAIRIEVNDELGGLGQALRNITRRLAVGGRLCCITFHSLEDRIVKNEFKTLADPCRCPRTIPYCVCGKTAEIKLITKKPIIPSAEEISSNPRSRSAKLRVIEKI
jgi:16S rRNA (cytosine1402-N4)-methyltransferase